MRNYIDEKKKERERERMFFQGTGRRVLFITTILKVNDVDDKVNM